MPREVDLTAVRPYADHLGDGLVQMSFTLPVPYSLAARRAALELAARMGFEEPEVVHYEQLTDGYTYFVMYGRCTATVDFAAMQGEGFDIEYMTEDEIERFAEEHDRAPDRGRGREHRLGHAQRGDRRDAQPQGLPRPPRPRGLPLLRDPQPRQPGAQQRAAGEGDRGAAPTRSSSPRRSPSRTSTCRTSPSSSRWSRPRAGAAQMILACGGPRVTNELAKELGYDAGFSKGTEPHHLATFIVRELAARTPARA